MVLIKTADYPEVIESSSGFLVNGLLFPDILPGSTTKVTTSYGGATTTYLVSSVTLPNKTLNLTVGAYGSDNTKKQTYLYERKNMNEAVLLNYIIPEIQNNRPFDFSTTAEFASINVRGWVTTGRMHQQLINGEESEHYPPEAQEYEMYIPAYIKRIAYYPANKLFRITYKTYESLNDIGVNQPVEYNFDQYITDNGQVSLEPIVEGLTFSPDPPEEYYKECKKALIITDDQKRDYLICSDGNFTLRESNEGFTISGQGQPYIKSVSNDNITTVFKESPFPVKSFVEGMIPLGSFEFPADATFNLNSENITTVEDVIIEDEEGNIIDSVNDNPFKAGNIDLIEPKTIKYDSRIYTSYKFQLTNIEELKIYINNKQVLLENFSEPYTGIYEFNQLSELKYNEMNTIKAICKYDNLEKVITGEWDKIPSDNNSLEGTELPTNNNADNIFDNINKVIKSINDTFLKLLDIASGFILLVQNMFIFLPPEILSLVLLGVSLSIILRIFGR